MIDQLKQLSEAAQRQRVVQLDPDLQKVPDIKEGYVLQGGPVRWHPYKQKYVQDQINAGRAAKRGRWQAMNEYAGWDNCETPSHIFIEPIDYPEALAKIEALEAQLTEARAQVAVAYEVAVDKHDELWRETDGYKSAQIRALTPDHATTALEQIKQQARDEGRREARRAAEARVAELEAGNGILHTEKHADAEAIGSLLSALTEIRDWRKSCHEYDKENGHDLREFDVEDLKMMEICARAAIKGASND